MAPGEGLEPSLSDFRDRRVANYTTPEQVRTARLELAIFWSTTRRFIQLSYVRKQLWQGWRDLNSLSQA